MENPNLTWMILGEIPISGNLELIGGTVHGRNPAPVGRWAKSIKIPSTLQ